MASPNEIPIYGEEIPNGNNICGLSKRKTLKEGRKEENDGGLEGLAHLSGSEGRVNTVVRVVSSRWFEEDTVTDPRLDPGLCSSADSLPLEGDPQSVVTEKH